MKKYLLFFLLPIFLGGCEKKYDNVVNTNLVSYQVESTSPGRFIYNPSDSSIVISLKVNSSANILSITSDIYTSNNDKLNNSSIQLLDNGKLANGDSSAGDNKYSNKFPLSKSYPIGIYAIKFYITDINNETKQAAIQNFQYYNGQNNLPPLLSNLNVQDTIKVADPKSVILMTVEVSDPNGLDDIKSVYFTVFRPDGTSSGNKTQMFDDGDFETDGDLKKGDSTFSILVEITPSNAKGTYRFDFQAVDLGGALSEIISHNIVVQ
jgi:hypothetical protein